MISEIFEHAGLSPAFDEVQSDKAKQLLDELTAGDVYARSLTAFDGSLVFLFKRSGKRMFGLIENDRVFAAELGASSTPVNVAGRDRRLTVKEFDASVAKFLRDKLLFLQPTTLGLAKSAGCGDRLGLATPGHVRAIRTSSMRPIFAQQSIRENARTGRTPQDVMDDALWGILQEGWRGGFGADADHLKNSADIDSCVAAGFTFFTIDPGDFVDSSADAASENVLGEKAAFSVPWGDLETSWSDLRRRFSRPVDLIRRKVTLAEEDLLRAAVKYGRVVAHTLKMFRHLKAVTAGKPFELEMSVDETDTVTSLAEHIYIASELKRLGVEWVSLAPRYVGTFEKGVDYIGNLEDFEKSFASHLEVATAFGPYKLSLHSGSDKFSIYPITSRLAGELVHLKTAGTSYLEALRTVARTNPELFRQIVSLACDRYSEDRSSYHVSARIELMPNPDGVADHDLTSLLDDFHAREILHVTYGSVLQHSDLAPSLFSTLREHEETYCQFLERHFTRHIAPFATSAQATGDGK